MSRHPEEVNAMIDIPMPASIRALPIDPVRKVPVPWFVSWIDGRPEFRAADGAKFARAIRERRCWVCGGRLDNRATYVIGPMCAINRVTAEPPCHPACAEYSARACPFLSRPGMVRRENDLPEGTTSAGIEIRRNPGVTCLWTGRTPGSKPFDAGNGILFRLFEPTAVTWWAEGRAATRGEVEDSVVSGLPILYRMAEEEGPGAVAELERLRIEAQPLFDRALFAGDRLIAPR
jgi:hypothetical protein